MGALNEQRPYGQLCEECPLSLYQSQRDFSQFFSFFDKKIICFLGIQYTNSIAEIS